MVKRRNLQKRELYLLLREKLPAAERKRLGITSTTSKKRMMELIEGELSGSGLFDFITKPIGKFFSPRLDFNNISKQTLKEWGDAGIENLVIMRAPITSAINHALQIVSAGAWNKVKKEANYDKLFHLSLICNVRKENRLESIIIEKNEVVLISRDFKTYPGYQTYTIAPPPAVRDTSVSTRVRRQGSVPMRAFTINDLVNNALKAVGRQKFFEYDAFTNNCQNFIMYLLEYSGLLTPETKAFIYQPMEKVIQGLPGYVPKMARMLTDLAATWNKLSGQGKDADGRTGKMEGVEGCGASGGLIAERSKGSRSNKKEEQYRQLLIAVAIDQGVRSGELSRNAAERAKQDARDPIYQDALRRIDSVKEETGQTYEQLYRGAEERYYATEEGQQVRAQQEADAEASAERRGMEIREREWNKFASANPALAGIVNIGKVVSPAIVEGLKQAINLVPGMPEIAKKGLSAGLDLAGAVAQGTGRGEEVVEMEEDIYGGQRKSAHGIMKQLKAYALGDGDIQEKLPEDTRIVIYNELKGLGSIDEILDEKGRVIILYPREAKNVGHWVCLFINKDGDYEFFCPYGDAPEETKRDLSPQKLAELDIEDDLLIPLLKFSAASSGRGVVYSKFPYQKLAPGINTCGRHCVARLAFHDADDDEYKAVLDKMKEGTDKSYDDIVSILTEI